MTRFINRRRPVRAPIVRGSISAVLVFTLLGVGGQAWAYWSATAEGTGTVSTQKASIGENNVSSIDTTFLPNDLTHTAGFSVSNTGQLPGTMGLLFQIADPLASSLQVQVWPANQLTDCTEAAAVPAYALSGTWAAFPDLGRSLNAGESAPFCVRTTIADWKAVTSATGSQSAVLKHYSTLAASGWVANGLTFTPTQKTAGMYPLTANFFDPMLSNWFSMRNRAANSLCLDVDRSQGVGGLLLTYSCQPNPNERWRFIPVAGSDQSLVTIQPMHTASARIGVDANGNQALVAPAANDPAQQWYIQAVPGTTPVTNQFVNAASGMCLSINKASSGSATTSPVTCDQASAQFQLQRNPLTFTQTDTTLRFTFGGIRTSSYSVKLQRFDGTNWVTTATTATGATFIEFAYSTLSTDATYVPAGKSQYRLISSSSIVWWSNIELDRNGTTVTAVGGVG